MKRHSPYLVPILWLAGLVSSQAEMPPSAYLNLQKEAPEKLLITVLSVREQSKASSAAIVVKVTVRAKVVEVKQTATGIRPGDTLVVIYTNTTHKTAWVGPSAVPILRDGMTCPAYLEQDEAKKAVYRPAAGGFSFREVNQ